MTDYEEPTLDDALAELPVRTRASHPDTSRRAAESVDVSPQALAVLDTLSRFDEPLLDEELVQAVARRGHKASPSGVRSRRATLVERGLVEQVGLGTMSTGRQGRTWRVTDAGRAVLRRRMAGAA